MLAERHTNSGAHVAIVLYVNLDLCVCEGHAASYCGI